jgi:hypothetical protein
MERTTGRPPFLVIPSGIVKKIGHGDVKKGHEILDAFVLKLRENKPGAMISLTVEDTDVPAKSIVLDKPHMLGNVQQDFNPIVEVASKSRRRY